MHTQTTRENDHIKQSALIKQNTWDTKSNSPKRHLEAVHLRVFMFICYGLNALKLLANNANQEPKCDFKTSIICVTHLLLKYLVNI